MFEKYFIYVVIFTSGVVTMTLEIIGVRMVAPIIGTTTAVWATIIGVILVALSLGYIIGGKIADVFPARNFIPLFLFLSAGTLFSLVYIKNLVWNIFPFLPYIGAGFISAVSLFLAPAMMLSAITTYAIRRTIASLDVVGTTSGLLYGISTAGNVFGIFTTSFFLIPRFPLFTIVSTFSFVLFAFAIISLTITKKQKGAPEIHGGTPPRFPLRG